MLSNLIAILFLTSTFPQIDVVYPRITPGDSIARINHVQKNFIFGSVNPPEAKLMINKYPVSVCDNGAFLAYLPVNWDVQHYSLEASLDGQESTIIVPFATKPEYEIETETHVSFPRMITLNNGIARTDPNGAYYIFPAKGTSVFTDGWMNGYFKVPLTSLQSVYIHEKYVSTTDTFIIQEPPIIWSAEVFPTQKAEIVKIPIGKKILTRSFVENNSKTIVINLYNSISHIDQIKFSRDLKSIADVSWNQEADNTVQITLDLTHCSWGYITYWEGPDFIISVKKPPELKGDLMGLHVVIDPGHGVDQVGAIGPTRLSEQEINYTVGIHLAEFLRGKGVKVSLTRGRDEDMTLIDRLRFAEISGGDILISIHHNALPDGTNPFSEFGTGTRFYHPQSRDLSLSIQEELVEELKFPDEGEITFRG